MVKTFVCLLVVSAACAASARAQQADAVPQGVSGSAGFGLSLTQGNSDTLNINATLDATYDPKTNNVMKWTAFYLRGKQNDVLSVNRVSASFRDEYTVTQRAFLFGEFDALHDTFKGVDYLYSPTAGVGYKLINTKRTTFHVDAGAGGVVERDTDSDAKWNGAVIFGEKLAHQLTETMTLKESAAGLLKMNDLADGLYTFQIGVAAKVSSRLQLAVDFLDTFKNHPVVGLTHKQDVAFVTSVVAKF